MAEVKWIDGFRENEMRTGRRESRFSFHSSLPFMGYGTVLFIRHHQWGIRDEMI